MASQESTFTKEDLKLLLNLGKRLVSNKVSKIVGEVKDRFNPDVRLASMLKAKYDALVAVGFDEKQAFELALKAVEKTLRQVIGKEEI